MKQTALVLFVVFSICTCTFAATVASDNAGNYTSWTNGANSGSGFGAWTLSLPANSGNYLGTSTTNAGGGSGGIDTGVQSFGLWANTGAAGHGYRPLTGGSLASDQRFRIDLDNGWIGSGGPSVGFGLQNSASNNLWEFYFAGGDGSYTINRNGGVFATGIPFTGNGLHVDFGFTGTTNFTVDITAYFNAGHTSFTNYTFTGSLLAQADQGVRQLHIWNANAGSGPNYDAFFNSMSVIPEPGTMALMGLALAGMTVFFRHVRRRRNF